MIFKSHLEADRNQALNDMKSKMASNHLYNVRRTSLPGGGGILDLNCKGVPTKIFLTLLQNFYLQTIDLLSTNDQLGF